MRRNRSNTVRIVRVTGKMAGWEGDLVGDWVGGWVAGG